MKYAIILFLLITPFLAYASPSCSKNGTSVIYTNGVTTTLVDAKSALKKIAMLSLDLGIDSKNVNYDLAYNYEESIAKDFLEAAVQRIPAEYLKNSGVTDPYAAFSNFYYGNGFQLISFQLYLATMEALTDSFAQSVNNYLVTQKTRPTYIRTISEIKGLYEGAFSRGERVFAISHSQGGLFMNDVYNLLAENDNKRKYFSGFQIASPLATSMNSHFGYATHDRDNLINFVRSTIGALPANIIAPFDLRNGISTAPSKDEQFRDFVIEYFLNHGILTTYLYDSTIRTQVISQLLLAAQQLESNCPKAIINSTKNYLQVNFDSTDPQNPNVTGLTYSWDFGDSQTLQTTTKAFSHSYLQGGTYNVSLTVTDAYENSDTVSVKVSVQPNIISFFVKINPKGTYLFTDTSGGFWIPPTFQILPDGTIASGGGYFIHDTADAPSYIDLTSLYSNPDIMLQEGDVITLQSVGAHQAEVVSPDTDTTLLGVFAGDNGFLYPGGEFNNVSNDSVPFAAPFHTQNSCTRNISTDIPYDFYIPKTGVKTIVPAGAKKLLFSVDDCLFVENSDPNYDFGVIVKITITRAGPGKPLLN